MNRLRIRIEDFALGFASGMCIGATIVSLMF